MCAGVGASLFLHNTEVSDRVQIRSSLDGSKRGEELHGGEEAAQKIPKAGPKQRLNPFM